MPDPASQNGDPNLPQFAIDPSKVKAVLTTAGSMVMFASTFSTAILGFVGKHDLAGAITYLQSAPVVTGLATVAGAAWLGYRMLNAKWKKEREVAIAAAAPNKVAMLTTELKAGLDASSPDSAPPTRAPEPKTPTPVDGPIITGMTAGATADGPQ